MKTTTKSILSLCSLLLSGTAIAQDHSVTYQQIFRAVDAPLVINGDTYNMARVPVRDLITGNRYSVILPASDGGGLYTSLSVVASHKPADFVSNIAIDGFPAHIQVFDSMNYLINTNFIAGGNDLFVSGSATVIVSIDIGETLVTLTNYVNTTNVAGDPYLTDVNIGNTLNAVPFAEWSKYGDRLGLIDALDKWIDYIRITTL